MNKLFKKVLYDVTRPYAKKHLTYNLGKVIEDDEKITCYVKKNKIKKSDCDYIIVCSGIAENDKNVAKAYNLNKPICYVIDGIELKKHKVYIFGYNNCEVIIKNCNFGLDLSVYVNGKCTLENTNITTFSYLSIGANDLVIKNMDSDKIRVISSESNICFDANNKINIINSNIGNQNKDIKVSFSATNELNIINSNIIGKKVECKSNIINSDEKSLLTATEKIELKTDDFNSINIDAPTIVINGEKMTNEKKSISLKKITDSLTEKRLELVNLLKIIKNKCENINSEKILEYQKELNIQPISKVLKK